MPQAGALSAQWRACLREAAGWLRSMVIWKVCPFFLSPVALRRLPASGLAQPRQRVAGWLDERLRGVLVFDLASFGLSDMLECSSAVRDVVSGAGSMEQAANAIAGYLYHHLLDKEAGGRALALARVFVTRPFEALGPDLRSFAAGHAGLTNRELAGTTCLVLLASVGDEPAWNDRHCSRHHQAVPMGRAETRAKYPMLCQLADLLGLGPHARRSDDARLCNIPEARACHDVADQDGFVARYGIRSVLGFGAMLPSGLGFAVVLFSRTPVPDSSADALYAVALGAKLAFLPFMDGPVFAGDASLKPAERTGEAALLRSQLGALERLLKVR